VPDSGKRRNPFRVARWFIFKPKIPIWVNFGGTFGVWKMFIFCGHLEYFIDIGDIL
jgi:hypothetical protein